MTWNINYNEQHLLKIFSDQESLNEYGYVSIPPSQETTEIINNYDGAILDDTVIIDDESGGQDIRLSLQDRIVSFVIDQSGSQSWTDANQKKLDVIERLIHRISSTYPGAVDYHLMSFGGEEASVQFSAVKSENNPFNPLYNTDRIFPADDFVDRLKDYYGVRILRKTDGFSESPIDGEILFDGVANVFLDKDIEAGLNYYYTIYTFDSDYHFSDPTYLDVTPYSGDPPKGINNFSGKSYKGIGADVYDDSLAIWHMNEDINDPYLYDFAGNVIIKVNTQYNPRFYSDINPHSSNALDFIKEHDSDNSVNPLDYSSELIFSDRSTPWSISLWFHPSESEDLKDGKIYEQAFTDDNLDISIYVYNDPKQIVVYWAGGNSVIFNVDHLIDFWPDWQHVVVMANPTTGDISVCVNGNISNILTQNSINYPNPPASTSTVKAYPGGNYGLISSDSLTGALTDIRIYEKILNNSEIENLYNGAFNDSVDYDNGRRIVALRYDVPSYADIIGGTIRIVRNDFHEPGNENDGFVVYENSSVTTGSYAISLPDVYIPGQTYYFRIFAQDVLGRWNNIKDSRTLEIVIPEISEAARQRLPVLSQNIPSPENVTILSGNAKTFIKWDLDNTSGLAERLVIASSIEKYPVISDFNYTSNVIAILDYNDEEFVHRDLLNSENYYYSIFTIDKYGRVSDIVNISSVPLVNSDSTSFTPIKVDKFSYEVINDNSIKLFWNDIPNERIIDAYFDEKIILYCRLQNEFGEILDRDYYTSYEIEIEKEVDEQAAPDVFVGGTEIFIPSDEQISNIVLEDLEEGESKGTFSLRFSDNNIQLLSSLKRITCKIRLVIYKPDINSIGENGNYTANIFEYKSKPIKIRYFNPIECSIINKDDNKISIQASSTVNAIDDSLIEYLDYNGLYIGSSNSYVARIQSQFKGDYNPNLNIMYAGIYNANKDLRNYNEEPLRNGLNKSLVTNIVDNRLSGGLKNIERLDAEKNATGVKQNYSVADLSIDTPESEHKVIIYIKVSMSNISIVRKSFVVFRSPLQMILTAKSPIINGLDKAEQVAQVYKIDPDNPEDMSKRTYPTDGTLVKWSLIKTLEDAPERALTSEDVVSVSSGVYSELENGLADNVFLGPIARVYGTDPDYEKLILKASAIYDGNTVSNQQTIQLLPLYLTDQTSASSHFLMEFDNLQERLFTSGRDYVRATIYHDVNSATGVYAETFRKCMNDMGKTIYRLQNGQLVHITAKDSDVEIIWGNVIEYVDPYTGEWLLDLSDAESSLGEAFVELSDDDMTEVFFRLNRDIPDQITTGYKSSKPLCEDLRANDYIKYKYEIPVYASITSIFEGKNVNMTAGGTFDEAIIPTVIVPINSLDISVVGRRANNNIINNLIIDGVTENEIILDISSDNVPVIEGTELEVSIYNFSDGTIYTKEDLIYTSTFVDDDWDALNARGYASLVLEGIPSNTNISSKIYISLRYTRNDKTNSKTICILIQYDTEDSLETSRVFGHNYKAELPPPMIGSYWHWELAADSSYPRAFCGSVNSNMDNYIAGGFSANNISNILEKYSPLTDTWDRLADMPTARIAPVAFRDDTGAKEYIYFIGGIEYDDTDRKLKVSNSFERYSVSDDEWEILENIPSYLNEYDYEYNDGWAYGSVIYDSSKIYLVSGIRYISEDGLSILYNDKILEYDVLSDIWSYIDVDESELSFYRRLVTHSNIIENTPYMCIGGIHINNNNNIEYLLDGYDYNPSTGVFNGLDLKPNNPLPLSYHNELLYETSSNKAFSFGGISNRTNYENIFFSYDLIGSSVFNEDVTFVPRGNQGGSFSYDSDYMGIVHSLYSGKGENFLQIILTTDQEYLNLNGKDNLDIKVELKDVSGNYPPGNIDVNLKAYLQNKNVIDEFANIISKSSSKLPVLFADDQITVTDGVGYARLEARSDDFIQELMNKISFVDGELNKRYKIVIQGTIIDSIYYGQNPVRVTDQDINIEESLADIPCLDIRTNIFLTNFWTKQGVNDEGFRIFSNPLIKEQPLVVDAVAKSIWFTKIDSLTEGGVVQSQEALDIIDDLKDNNQNGGTPGYDAIVKASNELSSESFDNVEKNMFIFTDRSIYGIEKSLKDAEKAVNNFGDLSKTSTVIINMNINGTILDGFTEDESTIKTINSLALSANTNTINIVSAEFEDEYVGTLAGLAKGGLGYGNAEFIIDLKYISRLINMSAIFTLPSNTNARWKISVSEDGCSFSETTDFFGPDYDASFDLKARYIKFYCELYSGLSSSNDPDYENIPVALAPSLDSVIVDYIPVKIDEIFVNVQSTDKEPLEVSMTTALNVDDRNESKVYMGVSTADSIQWKDFDTISTPAIKQSGNVILPIRYGNVSGETIEPLVYKNGFLYETKYGPWDYDSNVNIYDSNNNLINSNKYKIYPRKGLIMFNQRQIDNFSIEIVRSNQIKMALRIENDTVDESVAIYNLGYFYRTGE